MNAESTRKPAPKAAHVAAKTAARSPAKRPAAKATRKSAPIVAAPQGTKQSQLIEMLRSPAGGTIDQLMTLTGWQPHSVRGVISGALRKRLKLNVTCDKSIYRIVETQA